MRTQKPKNKFTGRPNLIGTIMLKYRVATLHGRTQTGTFFVPTTRQELSEYLKTIGIEPDALKEHEVKLTREQYMQLSEWVHKQHDIK